MTASRTSRLSIMIAGNAGPCRCLADVCEDCSSPAPHEGGLLAAADEWFHRHHRIPYRLYQPLCAWRDRRLIAGAD